MSEVAVINSVLPKISILASVSFSPHLLGATVLRIALIRLGIEICA